MAFLGVKLASFRNLEDGSVDTDRERVFLVGDNGQGKTNFLEALYYLSFGSSFRGPVDAEARRSGSPGFGLAAEVIPDFAARDLPPDDIRVSWEGKAKQIRRAGKPIRDRKELVDLNPAIVFCHEDFSFAAGEPERRRFFFDQTAGLVSPGYIDLLREYRRVLKQRNALLREGRSSLIDLYDEQLAGKGVELVAERERIAKEFADPFAALYEQVSQRGVEVRLSYRPSWREGGIEGAVERLRSRRAEELAMKTTLSGPHRDRWVFQSGSLDFASTASTGQLRLLSLALRTAQAGYYTRQTGRLPVLLLDDVLLELDPGKRRRFFEALPPSSQAFFTFLPGEPWEDYRGREALVYHVEHGRLARQEGG